MIKNACNENNRENNTSVLERIHPSYRDLGRSLYQVFGGKLIGLDVMTEDIGIALNDSGGAINEINIPPGLHYHHLVDNPNGGTDIGARILDYILESEHLTISATQASALQ